MRALDVDVSSEHAYNEVLKMIDPDSTGIIKFKMLTAVMEEKLKETDTKEDLLEYLKKLDLDNDGKISAPQFKQFMTNLGNRMRDEDVEELMKEADPKNEGVVDIDELADRLCPPKKWDYQLR